MRSFPRPAPWVLAALVCGCFNPVGSDSASSTTGSTGGVGSSSGASTSTSGPTTGLDGTTADASSTGTSTSGEVSTSGVVHETDTTGVDTTGVTTAGDDTSTGVRAVCGDGVVEDPEDCEDGNTEPDDGCSATCGRESRVVFVTNQNFAVSQIPTLGDADGLCMEMAKAGSVIPPLAKDSAYVAWLSDGVTSAKDRIGDSAVPYRLVDGAEVAANTVDLLSNGPKSAIYLDQFGISVPDDIEDCGANYVWTGTDPSGSSTSTHCEGWSPTEGRAYATVGNAKMVDMPWSEAAECDCTRTLRLYCFEAG